MKKKVKEGKKNIRKFKGEEICLRFGAYFKGDRNAENSVVLLVEQNFG